MIRTIFILLVTLINLNANIIDVDVLFENNNQNNMLLIDPISGKILRSNKSAQKFYQYSKKQLEDLSIKDINIFTPLQIQQEMQRAKNENRNYFIFRHRLKNAQIKRVEVHSFPITYNNKKVLFSIIDDISDIKKNNYNKTLEEQIDIKSKEIIAFEKKTKVFLIMGFMIQTIVIIFLIVAIRKRDKLQKEISDTNIKLANVLKGSDLGYWDWNIKTGDLDVNEKWLDILGLESSDIEHNKSDWEDRVLEEDKRKVLPIIEKAVKEDTTYTVEFRMKNKEGKYIWIEASGSLIQKDEYGHPLRLCGTHKDIQDRKSDEYKIKQLQEDKLEQQKQLLEQLKMVSMGEMIGNIAHQWRQPLSIISTGATGMQLKKQLDSLNDEDFNKTCELINENAQYLSKTIDDFRNFIKGDREKILFNLEDDIHSFLKLIESSRKNHAITIITDLEEGINLNGYPNELIQCFMNIFNNAKDALDEVEYNRYIFITSNKKEDNIIIKFRDNGGGIAKHALLKIFEPYFTTKDKTQGTGLGLHMTYNLIVDGMGGTITANNVEFLYESTKYKGAEFTISLPV